MAAEGVGSTSIGRRANNSIDDRVGDEDDGEEVKKANADLMKRLQELTLQERRAEKNLGGGAPSIVAMTNVTGVSCASTAYSQITASKTGQKLGRPAIDLEEALRNSSACEERLTRSPDFLIVAESMTQGLCKMREMTPRMLQSWTWFMRTHVRAEDAQVHERYMFAPPLTRNSYPVNLVEGLAALTLVLQPDGPGGLMDMMPVIRGDSNVAAYLFPSDGRIRLMLRDVTQMFHIAWSAQMSRLPNNERGDTQRNSDACLKLADHISAFALRGG